MLLESASCGAYLQTELVRRTQMNPRYSMRAFARLLGMSPGELSEVLRGKRRLSMKSTARIAKALGLNASEARHLAYLVQKELLGDTEVSDGLPRRELSLDLFNVISDWYCLAILTLSECEGFRWNEKYIASRLGISTAEVRVALERLKRVGLVEQNGNSLRLCRDYVLSPDGIPAEAIRNYHRQMLSKAIQSLDLQRIGERENIGIGFAVDPNDLPKIKKEISVFLDEVMAKYGKSKKKREVYQCEVALFRLSSGQELSEGKRESK